GYLEQRELDGIEENLLAAEERLATARARAEDPAVASDADALQKRYAELAEAQRAVDRLYERWAELEAKLQAQLP
ncbi:MAG TPA: ABC transporter C-terminal domain-containing protein, partial [Thermoanaerobaculia bacterium]